MTTSQVDQVRERVVEVVERLSRIKYVTAIGDLLRATGVKGEPMSENTCPVARYIQREAGIADSFLDVTVEDHVIVLWADQFDREEMTTHDTNVDGERITNMPEILYRCDTPELVVEFINYFDNCDPNFRDLALPGWRVQYSVKSISPFIEDITIPSWEYVGEEVTP